MIVVQRSAFYSGTFRGDGKALQCCHFDKTLVKYRNIINDRKESTPK